MFSGLAELWPYFRGILTLWWVWVPVLCYLVFAAVWITYVRLKYKLGVAWVLLEVRVPREVRKTPKAMEQIFAGLHALRNNPTDFLERYVNGEVTLWFSMEVVSLSGDTHFFVRTPAKHRNVVEALFYGQYPDIEIVEADDYVEDLPETLAGLNREGYDLWGTELKLAKDDAYPIRTFEDFKAVAEEEQLDPVSALLEVFGKVQRGDKVFLQILVRPTGDDWIKEGKKLIEKLRTANVIQLTDGGEKTLARTPGETDILKAVEKNISKPGFETIIRYLTIGPKKTFNSGYVATGIFSCFNQYATMHMNAFKRDTTKTTKADWHKWPFFYPAARAEKKKRKLWRAYRDRKMPEPPIFILHGATRPFVLNTEELATVWHLPSFLIQTGPLMKRVESRKMGAPAGLPIFTAAENSASPWDVPPKP